MPFDYFSLLAFASKEDAEAVVSMTSGPEGQKTSCVPALLGVSPAAREQRDKLAGLLRKVIAYCAERWVVGQHRTLDMDLLEEIEAALDEVGGATQEREGREADVS
jgi:hypothetical protein